MKTTLTLFAIGALLLSCKSKKTFSGSATSIQAPSVAEATEVESEAPTPAPPKVPEGFVSTVEVAVNFEDKPGGDSDFNDAVLCFKGSFNVSPTEIISKTTQNIQGSLHSHSGCVHDLIIS